MHTSMFASTLPSMLTLRTYVSKVDQQLGVRPRCMYTVYTDTPTFSNAACCKDWRSMKRKKEKNEQISEGNHKLKQAKVSTQIDNHSNSQYMCKHNFYLLMSSVIPVSPLISKHLVCSQLQKKNNWSTARFIATQQSFI